MSRGDPRRNVRFGVYGRSSGRTAQRMLFLELVDKCIDAGDVRSQCADESQLDRTRPRSVNRPRCRRRDDCSRNKPRSGYEAVGQPSGDAEAHDRACAPCDHAFERNEQLLRIAATDESPHARSGGDPRFDGETGYGNDAHMPRRK